MADPNTRPRIGDFRSKPDNAPRKPPAETGAPEVAGDKAPEKAEGGATPEEVPEEKLTPKDRYARRLKEADISLSMAQSIFDAVVSKGYYEEYVKVGANRAVLRTRLYDDHLRLQTALEATRPGLVMTQEDMITRYNLAASLYEWRGKPLKHDSDDDFDAVMDEVKKLPAPIYSMLVQRLAEFDRKVMLVFSEGATDSF